jgi:hypothetical protein
VWKRWGRVIRAAWAADLKRAVRMRAREMELAGGVRIRADGMEHPRTFGRLLVPDIKNL